jgi:trigger factor
MDKKYSFTKEETKNKEIKLTVKVIPAEFMVVKEKVYNKLAKDVVITGFRPGKGPKNLIEARISGELYEETINKLLPEVTYEIITEEKYTPLNQLHYEVLKMSDAEGIEFSATFVNAPSIKLADFKKIKATKEEVKVTDQDVAVEVERLIKTYGPKKDEKDAAETNEAAVKVEVTDEVIKALNLGFDSKDKLEEQIKKELEANKQYEQEQKYITTIVDEAIKGSKIEAPKALVEEELHKREHEYTHQIEDLGLKVEDFLKSQNTTMEDMKKDWEKDANKRIQEELLLYQVIKENALTVSQEEIVKEINAIQDENTKKKMQTESGIRYMSTVMLQQKAINFIRDQVNKG